MKRTLRSPRLIVLEVVVIALAGLAGAIVPQTSGDEASQLALEWPWLSAVVSACGLDRVFRAPWFLGVVLLATASLVLVQVEQWRRVAREWRAPLVARSFERATFRRELVRAGPGAGSSSRFHTSGRAGALGSPIMHLGLLVVVGAGLARMLFTGEAVVDLFEGETLDPSPSAYGRQVLGTFASPVALPAPITVERLAARHYDSGSLEQIEASIAVAGDPARRVTVAINQPLDLGRERLYVTATRGPVAFLEVEFRGEVSRRALLLRGAGRGAHEFSEVMPGLVQLRLRADGPELPDRLELRALRDGALLATGAIAPGQAVTLPSGHRLTLHGIRSWARFQVSRDVSTPIAYAGFALVLAGALLLFAVVRVDTAVIVTTEGERERVVVALRAQRFAPLFAERFEELVRTEAAGTGRIMGA